MSANTTASRSHNRVIQLSATAALGGFLFGFDSAIVNGAVEAVSKYFNASSFEKGFAVSAALLGAALGAWYAGRIADRLGRPRAMQLAGVVFLLSAIFTAIPFALWEFTLWRFVGGIGTGLASVIAPMYIAEVAPAHLRGRLGSLQQMAIVLGIFAATLTSYVLAHIAGSAESDLWGLTAWQWMFLSGAFPSALYIWMATLIPNSPRWLVMVGRDSEAPAIISELDPTLDPDLEVAAIRESLGTRQGTLRDLLGPFLGLRKIVWIGIAASVLQQFVGINVIFYYSSTLWQSVGFGESQSLLISVISSTTNIVATIVAIALIDRVGRKPLLMAGSIGMSIGLLTLAIIFANAGVDANGNPALEGLEGPVALVAANVFVFFFGLSWGPVVWVLLGEMFPNSIRAVALSVAAAAQWIANFIVSTTFPALAAIGLGLAYGLYASFAIISIFFVARVLQETKGRTLESMVG